MEIMIALISLASVACIFAVISLVLSIYNLIETKSMQKATHSVQFMPAESVLSSEQGEDTEWGHTEDEITKINENNKDGDEETYIV